MKVTHDAENGTLTIVIDTENPPRLSGSGKTLLVASETDKSSHGVKVDGKPLTVAVNAYIKA